MRLSGSSDEDNALKSWHHTKVRVGATSSAQMSLHPTWNPRGRRKTGDSKSTNLDAGALPHGVDAETEVAT